MNKKNEPKECSHHWQDITEEVDEMHKAVYSSETSGCSWRRCGLCDAVEFKPLLTYSYAVTMKAVKSVLCGLRGHNWKEVSVHIEAAHKMVNGRETGSTWKRCARCTLTVRIPPSKPVWIRV